MVLDNEQQRVHLLSLIAATPLAGGTVKHLKQQIAVLDELEESIRNAEIAEEVPK